MLKGVPPPPSQAVSIGLKKPIVHFCNLSKRPLDKLGVFGDFGIKFLNLFAADIGLDPRELGVDPGIIPIQAQLFLFLLERVLQGAPLLHVAIGIDGVGGGLIGNLHKRLHELEVTANSLLVGLLLEVLGEEGEVVAVLAVMQAGLGREQLEVVRGAVEDIVVVACPAILDEGVHSKRIFPEQ